MSFQGLSIAVETVRIVKELMEIWPNEVCDSLENIVRGLNSILKLVILVIKVKIVTYFA